MGNSSGALPKLAETLHRIGLHDHLCLIYETQAEQFAAIMPFTRLGLERGERVIYIADDNTAAVVLQAMRLEGIDVDQAMGVGALTIANKQETYLKQGYFDPDRMIAFLQEATRASQAAGYAGLRVAGEMTWALGGDPGVERLIEYEARLNQFFPYYEAMAICQYNRHRFNSEILINVIHTHPQVIFGGLVCQNFYYVPPEEFLAPEQPKLEVERLLRNIVARERDKVELQQSHLQLEAINNQLTREIAERKQAEAALQEAYAELERRVSERTAELLHANASLRIEAGERQRIEAELFNSHRFSQQITEASPSILYIYDLIEQKNVYINSRIEELMGYTAEEFQALGPAVLPHVIHPDDLPRVMEHHRRVAETGEHEPLEIEYRFKTAGGEWRWLYSRDVLFARLPDGTPHQILGAALDMTERRQAEERLARQAQELARSNAELEQYAYVASHDLQEPLRMIASYLQLLERRYKGRLDADADDFIHYAVDGARRMQQLINDLLLYSRVGTHGRQFTPTNTGLVLQQALVNLQRAVEEASGRITVEGTLPTVLADHSQLLQLFQNLLGNALKFRGEQPPEISIGAARQDGEWLFWVRDNGLGIDPRHADRIFLIFQRLHTRAEYPGTGIGLAICKKIVDHHGGRIWVESEPDRGATFYFTIPNQREELTA